MRTGSSVAAQAVRDSVGPRPYRVPRRRRKAFVRIEFRVRVIEVVLFVPIVRQFRVPFGGRTVAIGTLVIGVQVG